MVGCDGIRGGTGATNLRSTGPLVAFVSPFGAMPSPSTSGRRSSADVSLREGSSGGGSVIRWETGSSTVVSCQRSCTRFLLGSGGGLLILDLSSRRLFKSYQCGQDGVLFCYGTLAVAVLNVLLGIRK